MPPKKKGVPWFVTEKAKSSPFDKFITEVKTALSRKVGSTVDPDWDTYTYLLDKPENAEFKTMRDASGKTIEDYGFEAYIQGVRSAMAMKPPKWEYYDDMVDYLPEFKDRRDSAGKTAEDYVFEVFIAVTKALVDADPPKWELYNSMINNHPNLKDRKDTTGKSAVDYGFETFMEIVLDILEDDDLYTMWDDYGEFLDYFPQFRTMKDDKGKTVMDYGFDKLKQMIDEREDKRTYSMFLKDHPEFFSMKDANGKTLLMYAAESDYVDAVVSMIEDGADVRIKDNEGKTVYEHAEEAFNKELNRLAERYKDDPDQLAFEQEEVNDSKNYLLKAIKDAEAKLVARDIAPLAATSKSVSEIGGPIPSIGAVAEFLTGKKGPPKAQREATKQQLGRGRKTRRKSKKSKKSRRV